MSGEIVAIMEVFVRPPRESCRSRVSLLSLWKRNSSLSIRTTCQQPLQSNNGTAKVKQPVGDVRSFVHESGDDPAQGQEWLIDVPCATIKTPLLGSSLPVELLIVQKLWVLPWLYVQTQTRVRGDKTITQDLNANHGLPAHPCAITLYCCRPPPPTKWPICN